MNLDQESSSQLKIISLEQKEQYKLEADYSIATILQ